MNKCCPSCCIFVCFSLLEFVAMDLQVIEILLFRRYLTIYGHNVRPSSLSAKKKEVRDDFLFLLRIHSTFVESEKYKTKSEKFVYVLLFETQR